MFAVVSSNATPHHLRQLREWFVAEWGQVDPFESTKDGFSVPSPLLSVDGQKLLGGLAFTRYPVSGSEEVRLWINALFVAPEYRGLGLASRLVQAAEVEAARIKEEELFVYTNTPELYQKLGWLILNCSAESIVLKRVIENRWKAHNNK